MRRGRRTTTIGQHGDSDAKAARDYHIVVRELRLDCGVGVFRHERGARQPVLVSLDLLVDEPPDLDADDYAAVPCYKRITDDIIALAEQGHVRLIETLAHRIALLCLRDARVRRATVRVDKPQALEQARAAGVEVTRSRADTPS